ncbi:MAG: thioredoxin family protein [Bacteroidetes bacterium]|nr:thioredoxin family protein [Bacteroidota bacterium]
MKYVFLSVILVLAASAFSQDMKKFSLYKPEDGAEKSIAAAVKEAKQKNKHVFIQIGGNWCVWCARFNDFITSDSALDSVINQNFVVYHLNYSKENYNKATIEKYGFPQRFGFPVFLILNGNGTLLHTQNSVYLEEQKSYNRKKVMDFFSDWSPKGFDPSNYKEQ